jgi:superfamily II DNA or RNA helicase
MQELYENNTTEYKKVIAFSQFASAPPILSDIASRLGDEAILVTGATDKDERDRLITRFQNEAKYKYLLGTYGVLQEGFTITAAGSVIHCDFAYTPKTHIQAEGRAYGRLNDLHTIDSYYIETIDTIEPEIRRLMSKKEMTADKVLDNADISELTIGSIQMDLLNVLKLQREAMKKK